MQLSIITKTLGIEFPTDAAPDAQVAAICSPETAGANDIVFLADVRFAAEVEECAAGFVIVKRGRSIPGKVCLEVDDPYVGYAKVAQLFEKRMPSFEPGVSGSAFIDRAASLAPSVSVGPGTVVAANVTIGERCRIGGHCVIEKGCVIGDDCRIDSGAIIRYGTVIGNRVTIQSGAVIGSDGFGNARENGVFVRIPPFGNVIIHDDAEIGANTTIDRGNFNPTVIGKGVKLDNLIHIAHNVIVGDHSAMAAQTGISGSTRVGKRVMIGGQAGFVGHIEIGDDAFVGAKAGVSKSVEPKAMITGYPARDLMTMRRIEGAEAHLPQLLKDFRAVRKQLDELQTAINSINASGGKGPATEPT